jgi:hypothetical protein
MIGLFDTVPSTEVLIGYLLGRAPDPIASTMCSHRVGTGNGELGFHMVVTELHQRPAYRQYRKLDLARLILDKSNDLEAWQRLETTSDQPSDPFF